MYYVLHKSVIHKSLKKDINNNEKTCRNNNEKTFQIFKSLSNKNQPSILN